MNTVHTAQMKEFNRLYKEAENIYSRYAASHGISPTTLCILYSIYTEDRPCTQTRLVENWGIPMQTVNSCLKALEKSGIVRLEFADGNRKRKCILLTDQGNKTIGRIVAPLVEAENKALGALEPEERQALMLLTRKHTLLLKSFLPNQK